MKEDFLQIIWQMQGYDLPAVSTEGVNITVLKPGIRNREDGPDFRFARIMMDGIEWNGAVEVHIRSGEWNQHGHQKDAAYEAVILHVVWEEDCILYRNDGSRIPTLELRNRIPLETILNYRRLLNRKEGLPCQGMLIAVPDILKESMLERALVTRLERKAGAFLDRLKLCGFNWHRTALMMLARCLGMPGNEAPMEYLAEQIPSVFFHSRPDLQGELSKFLLGLSGLSGTGRKESPHLQRIPEIPIAWQKSGRRPGAFPQKRIGILAAIIPHLAEWIQQGVDEALSRFFETKGVSLSQEIRSLLDLNFGLPLRMAMAMHSGEKMPVEEVLDAFNAYKAEDNRISRKMVRSGMLMQTAAHSQGGKELHDYWCAPKRCMDCRIGQSILKPITLRG